MTPFDAKNIIDDLAKLNAQGDRMPQKEFDETVERLRKQGITVSVNRRQHEQAAAEPYR